METHPYPDMIEPRIWCAACRWHSADGILCPVCQDDQAHGINVILGTPQPNDGRGTE